MSRRIYADGALVEEWDDGTRTYRRLAAGEVVEERPYSEDEAAALQQADVDSQRQAARASLLAKVDTALVADLDYLALNPPTTAQAVAQVGRLTRQVVALLRLVGNRLDDTTGT